VLAHQGRPPDAPTIETIVPLIFCEIINFLGEGSYALTPGTKKSKKETDSG